MDLINICKEMKIRTEGTVENLLFRASDIGSILEFIDINNTIRTFNDNEKVKVKIQTETRGIQEVNYLTINGIKRLISKSRKVNAIDVAKKLGIDRIYSTPLETEVVDFIKKTYPNEELICQYRIDPYKIDLYFPKYKLAVECDEYHHKYKENKDKEREDYIKKQINCEFIRFKQANVKGKEHTNNMAELINKINSYINSYNLNYEYLKQQELIKSDYSKYEKVIEMEYLKQKVELEKAQKEKLIIQKDMLKILTDSGVDMNKAIEKINLIDDKDYSFVEFKEQKEQIQEQKEIQKQEEKKEIKNKNIENKIEKAIKDGVKCSGCGKTKERSDYDYNPYTKRLYSSCNECRIKASEKRKNESMESVMASDKEYEERVKQIQEKRKKLLESIELQKCFICKIDKLPINFGINKQNNELYRKCIECRNKNGEDNNEENNEQNTEDYVECSKDSCRALFPKEFNKLRNTFYRMCKKCREKDSKNRTNSKIPPTKCSKAKCGKVMEPELNKKGNYYRTCRECRGIDPDDNTNKYEEELKKKQEYYKENRESIRIKQNERYDEHKKFDS